MSSAANDSSVIPQPASGLAIPARVYITVSRSGQTRKPQRSKSSAVFTTTARSPGGSTASRPAASFAPPTPPASASTLIVPPRRGPARPGASHPSCVGAAFQRVAHDRYEAQRISDLPVERHLQCLVQRKAANVEPLRTLGLTLAGHQAGGEEPHRVLVRDGVRQVCLPEHPPARGFEPRLFPQLALRRAQRLLALGAT